MRATGAWAMRGMDMVLVRDNVQPATSCMNCMQ